MINKLQKIKDSFSGIDQVKNLAELESLENKYLSRKNGELVEILKGLASLSLEEKREVGGVANQVKKELEEKIKQKREELSNVAVKLDFDPTLPIEKNRLGHLHPLTQIQDELLDIFASMGFMSLDGPELESEYYNFDALNIPATHPARDMQDTFFVEGDDQDNRLVMRTHTSPVQIRAMQKYGVPFRGVVPGKVFRSEALDARHSHTFYQMEGLMVDENISVANLIAVIKTFLHGVFQKEVEVRLRPGYFPFVEPGFELDFSCLICGSKGCKVCKGTGWVEFMGSGMVHPNVLKAGNVDPKKYSGFAFGFGIERLVMMRYGIDDLRLFHSGDLRFLRQF